MALAGTGRVGFTEVDRFLTSPSGRARIAMDVLSEMIAAAVRLHQGGDLTQAEALYRGILETQPDHPCAMHLLGVVAHQRGPPAIPSRCWNTGSMSRGARQRGRRPSGSHGARRPDRR
jgi:hypothetical protein